MQTWASVEYGYWYARSAEFLQTDVMHTLRSMRVLGDTLFAAGVVSLAFFVADLAIRGSAQRSKHEPRPSKTGAS